MDAAAKADAGGSGGGGGDGGDVHALAEREIRAARAKVRRPAWSVHAAAARLASTTATADAAARQRVRLRRARGADPCACPRRRPRRPAGRGAAPRARADARALSPHRGSVAPGRGCRGTRARPLPCHPPPLPPRPWHRTTPQSSGWSGLATRLLRMPAPAPRATTVPTTAAARTSASRASSSSPWPTTSVRGRRAGGAALLLLLRRLVQLTLRPCPSGRRNSGRAVAGARAVHAATAASGGREREAD